MKTIVFITLLLSLSIGLFAHPASNVTLNYDATTLLLTVNFEHSVKNPADHYISEMIIKIDGKQIISQNLPLQENPTGGSLVYKLPGLKTGNLIEAVAVCNKIGKKSAKLTIK